MKYYQYFSLSYVYTRHKYHPEKLHIIIVQMNNIMEGAFSSSYPQMSNVSDLLRQVTH